MFRTSLVTRKCFQAIAIREMDAQTSWTPNFATLPVGLSGTGDSPVFPGRARSRERSPNLTGKMPVPRETAASPSHGLAARATFPNRENTTKAP